MGLGGQLYAPAVLPLEKTPGIHCTGGWVGTRVGGDGCEIVCPNRDTIPGLCLY